MRPLYEHIVFDLDDTLLDTSGSLIPLAVHRACQAMVDAGLPLSVSDAVRRRQEILRENPRTDVWSKLAQRAPEADREKLIHAGEVAFYQYNVEDLPADAFRPQEGALQLLAFSAKHSHLHLVSAGDPETQRKKIERLGISKFFTSVHIVNPVPGAKHQAFAEIEKKHRTLSEQRFVSIGNRVDTDLGEAKALGWSTIWIRAGEHVGILPKTTNEIPDFEVSSPLVLLHLWQQQFPLTKEQQP